MAAPGLAEMSDTGAAALRRTLDAWTAGAAARRGTLAGP